MKHYLLLLAYYVAYGIQHVLIFAPYYLWHGKKHRYYDSNRRAFRYCVRETKRNLGITYCNNHKHQ
jgi:hypothetical protein